MHTLIAPSVNLLILILVMVYYLRQPLKQFVKTRQTALADDLKKAQGMLHEAQIKYEEFSAKLKAVDAEVTTLRAQARQDAETVKTNILAEAKKLSASIVNDAQSSSQGLYAELKGQLYGELGARVLERAEALLRDRLTGDDRARIRKEFSQQVESVR